MDNGTAIDRTAIDDRSHDSCRARRRFRRRMRGQHPHESRICRPRIVEMVWEDMTPPKRSREQGVENAITVARWSEGLANAISSDLHTRELPRAVQDYRTRRFEMSEPQGARDRTMCGHQGHAILSDEDFYTRCCPALMSGGKPHLHLECPDRTVQDAGEQLIARAESTMTTDPHRRSIYAEGALACSRAISRADVMRDQAQKRCEQRFLKQQQARRWC